MRKYVGLLVLTVAMTVGCQKKVNTETPAPPAPIEMKARDAVATAKGYLDAAKLKHTECPADTASTQCQVLAKGTASKDTLINALNVYCAGPEYDAGGACTPHSDQISKLSAALSNVQQIMSDLEKLK